MRDAFQFTINGAEGTVRRLNEIPRNLQKKGLPRAARKAMSIVRNAARATAREFDDPETFQEIWRLIHIRRGRLSGPGVRMRVGILGGAKGTKGKQHPWYWRLLELGSEKMAARPFMRPALETNAKAVADRFVRELNVELDILSDIEG